VLNSTLRSQLEARSDDSPPTTPSDTIDKTLSLLRLHLAKGSMLLWRDRCTLMSSWWRIATSDHGEAVGLLLRSSIANDLRKRAADARSLKKWVRNRDLLHRSAAPDSWSCPRGRSSKLRSEPVQRTSVGFSSSETIEELMSWRAGELATAPDSRFSVLRGFLHWY
jgi:hypothetical protein